MELGAPLTTRERPLPWDLCVSLTLTGSGNECTVLVPGHLSPHLGKNCSPSAQPALGNLLWGEGGGREGNPRRGEEALEGAQRNAVRAGPWHHRASGSLLLASLLTTQSRMFWVLLENSLGSLRLCNIRGALSNLLHEEDGPGVPFAGMGMPGHSGRAPE